MPRAWLGAVIASMIARAASATNANFLGRVSLSTLMPRFLPPHLGRDRVTGDSTVNVSHQLAVSRSATRRPPVRAAFACRPARRDSKNPQGGVLLQRSRALCPLNGMGHDDSVGDARSPIEHVIAGSWWRER